MTGSCTPEVLIDELLRARNSITCLLLEGAELPMMDRSHLLVGGDWSPLGGKKVYFGVTFLLCSYPLKFLFSSLYHDYLDLITLPGKVVKNET